MFQFVDKFVEKFFPKKTKPEEVMQTIEPDVAKTYRVYDIGLETFLADRAEWRKENFITVDGHIQPNGANAFEQDQQRFTDWCWQREEDQIRGAKLATYREIHDAEKLSKTA